MKEVEDFEEDCETRLDSLGYELVDLGTDLDSNAHCYSIFQKSNGELVTLQLLSIRDVLAFVDGHGSVRSASLETKKAG